MRNGTAAFQRSVIFIWGVTPFITNRISPNGGVVNPISTLRHIKIANHIGLKPKAITTGIYRGRSIITIELSSMTQPRARTTRFMAMMTVIGGKPREVSHVTNPLLIPLKAKIWLKAFIPSNRVNNMIVIRVALPKALLIIGPLKHR